MWFSIKYWMIFVFYVLTSRKQKVILQCAYNTIHTFSGIKYILWHVCLTLWAIWRQKWRVLTKWRLDPHCRSHSWWIHLGRTSCFAIFLTVKQIFGTMTTSIRVANTFSLPMKKKVFFSSLDHTFLSTCFSKTYTRPMRPLIGKLQV